MLMPWWIKVYTILFIIIVISNLVFQLKNKTKKSILCYEFISALYMVFLIYAYWSPIILHIINILNVIALALIIGIDFYLTIWGDEEELGLKIPAMSKKEIDIAKAASILFAAPAYITGLLVSCHMITTNYF